MSKPSEFIVVCLIAVIAFVMLAKSGLFVVRHDPIYPPLPTSVPVIDEPKKTAVCPPVRHAAMKRRTRIELPQRKPHVAKASAKLPVCIYKGQRIDCSDIVPN